MAVLYKETLDFFNNNKMRSRVFLDKYALRDKHDRILEKTPKQMWRRVANAIASTEIEFEKWSKDFYWLLEDFRFIPGGRINYGAGNQFVRNTLINCYVIELPNDSIEGIFDAMKHAARTFSYGGGVGIDISMLRYKGAKVNNSARYSTGAVSFMDLFSLTTGTIGQYNRRGALLISIDIQHPDVIDFITIKNDKGRSKVRYANISIRMRDSFFKAVEEDRDWILWYPEMTDIRFSEDAIKVDDILECYDHPEETFFKVDKEPFIRVKKIVKTIKARELWDMIVRNAWESAEPGILFWDTAITESPSEYFQKIKTTNPCGEQPLPWGGACCLGHINLAKIVKNSYDNPEVDWDLLEKITHLAVRFLDGVLEYNKDLHPLEQQKISSIESRRIGLGVTGLADFLARMKLEYDSDEAIELAEKVMEFIKNEAYKASALIAKEKGTFPKFNLKKHLERPFIQRLSEETLELIKSYGLRNATLLTVAPVGTGSILAGTTSGIEPLFAKRYIRRSESLKEKKFILHDPSLEEYVSKYGTDLPSYFKTAYDIDPFKRIDMQAALQRHTDASISSTINLKSDFPMETLSELFMYAWKKKLKGVTIYRDGSREGILKVAEDDSVEKK